MEIKTFKDLIKAVNNIAELKIKQGIELKTLALSIKQNRNDKSVKEWKKEINDLLERI